MPILERNVGREAISAALPPLPMASHFSALACGPYIIRSGVPKPARKVVRTCICTSARSPWGSGLAACIAGATIGTKVGLSSTDDVRAQRVLDLAQLDAEN